MTERFYFDRAILDRASHLRRDDPGADTDGGRIKKVYIPVWRDKSLVWTEDTPRAVMLESGDAVWFVQNATQVIFLGFADNVAYYSADLSHHDSPDGAPVPDGASFEELRGLATRIDSEQAGYLAYARALGHWNRTHMYCGVCGSPTISGKSGHERICSNGDCGRAHFPRTDPAVIMLVTHPTEDMCLLGHNKRFKGLRYSTVAGFVEPGESLEHAVAREVQEETGIEVTDVAYQASQPWPFPASIMLGFRAKGTTTEINLLDKELIDAKWFSRDDVREMAEQTDILPPPAYSISRWLIDCWLAGR